MAKKKILFICGSLNQTTINHQVAAHLEEYECWFTPFYGDRTAEALARTGLLDFSIMGRRARSTAEAFLHKAGCLIDMGGILYDYNLIVTCTDLFLPKNVREKNLILIQEGMIDPEGVAYRLVRALGLPRYLANTSMTGLSHAYRAFCVASEGFRDVFAQKGADPRRLRVTGIPNFDKVRTFLVNDFPYKDYVLVATSHLRECGKFDNRRRFIAEALEIAGGRPVFFKLHPLENISRAASEIRRYAPGCPVFTQANTNHMVANCAALVTRYSSVALIAAALGKEIHSDLDDEFLQRVAPLQNGGLSSRNIAGVCREFL